jgi:hypothetical protein
VITANLPKLEPPFDAAVTDGWLTVTAPDHERPIMGEPGLWKHRGGDDAAGLVCDLPVPAGAALADGVFLEWSDDVEPAERLDALVTWACASYRGIVDAAWSAPDVGRLTELLPEADRDLALRRGGLMTAARFTGEPEEGRLALGVTLATVPADLDPIRRRWLEHVVAGADALRLVRVGFTDDPLGAVIRAEVDLSGAPASALPVIVRSGFSALRCIYSGFAPTLSVIGDPAWSSTTLTTRDPDAPFRSSPKSS